MYRERRRLSWQTPHICAVWRQSAVENDKWERVRREGEKPASVLQFIWSFISERERDRWRNMEMEGKAAEQKESRDFQMKKRRLCEINKYSLLFLTHYYIQHTWCHCFLPVTSWRNLKLRWSRLQALHISNRSITLCVEYRQPLLRWVRGWSPQNKESEWIRWCEK